MKQPPRRTLLILSLIVAALGGALLAPTLLGQAMVGSGGHALDRNLQLGSGGYNTHRGVQTTTWSRPSYAPGSSSKPLYTVTSSGGMAYSSHNAFNPNSRYTSTGYTDDYTTTASLRRARSYR